METYPSSSETSLLPHLETREVIEMTEKCDRPEKLPAVLYVGIRQSYFEAFNLCVGIGRAYHSLACAWLESIVI